MKEPTTRIGVATGIGVFLMAASYIAEYVLDRNGISPADTFFDNILIGVSAGLLIYIWATLITERAARSLLIERLKQEAVSQERHRVAREIHDTVAQALMAISLQLEAAKDIMESNDPAQAADHINRAQSMAREGLVEARRVVWALHPEALEGEGLTGALQRLTKKISDHRELATAFALHGEPCRLPGEIEANVLRVAQEALSNAIKHSGARNIHVELSYGSEEVQLVVKDDGKGFHMENRRLRRGFGLTSMQERCQRIGAHLSIESRRGAGTRVKLVFPAHVRAIADVPQEEKQDI